MYGKKDDSILKSIKPPQTILFLVIFFFAILILVTGCATTREPPAVRPAPEPETKAKPIESVPSIPTDIAIKNCFRAFELKFTPSNAGYRNGRIYIGIHSTFTLALILPQECPMEIDPAGLFARIGHLKFYFSLKNGNKEFFTRDISINKSGVNIAADAIGIYYQHLDQEIFLDKWPKSIVIDTRTPPAPKDLRVEECGPDLFRLKWKPGKESNDVKEYVIQKFEFGNWVKLPPGSVATPGVTINKKPEGRIRLMAVDWAGNQSFSDELEVRCEPFRITSMKILAPKKDTGHINDQVVTGNDALNYAYAVEVTANKKGKLMLVNVDAMGYGYRLFPTPCKTGSGFDPSMQASVPKRYPDNPDQNIYYIGLDEVTGLEDIYAILYEDDDVQKQVWNWVLNEICNYEQTKDSATPKGSRELPGMTIPGGKKKVAEFEKKLEALTKQYQGSMTWKNRSFLHTER